MVCKVVPEIGSGTTEIAKRTAIEELKRSVLVLGIQKVLVSEISRLGRTTSESLSVIDFLTKHKTSCYEYQRRIETLNADLTINPIAELIMSVLASCAKMEKAQFISRIISDMASAVRKGKHLGRPSGTVLASDAFLQKNKMIAKSLVAESLSARKTAKLYNVSVSNVMKVKKMITA